MRKKSKYVISFTSLQDGKHEYHYKIENKFFEQFDYSDIEGASLKLDVLLEKKPNMIIVQFDIEGSIEVMCDKCTDSFSYSVTGKDETIYKFSDEQLDDEKVVCILPNEVDIDITIPIYEFVSLLLPSRRVHPDGECNEEMLKEIDNYLIVDEKIENTEESDKTVEEEEENEIDPRWSQLKELKNKK